jgi:predicted N-acetyltransferase YhbS
MLDAQIRHFRGRALLRILPLHMVEPHAVEALLDAAFGADRHARTAYRIRAGMSALPKLSFAAVAEDGGLAGTVQSWPVALEGDDASVPLVLVGPVAVAPALQRAGTGSALMRAMLTAADTAEAPPQVLIGDPEYYGRFGFSDAATGGWNAPGPFERRRLLARGAGSDLPRHGMLAPRRWTATAPAR